MNVKMEGIPVPPGFVSLTTFTLKRDELEAEKNNQEISPVNLSNLKRSLKDRPWILTDKLDDLSVESDSSIDMNVSSRASLPKGVIRGCTNCKNCQKITANWRPEESCKHVLEDVPVFYPTEEEFKDALNYIAKIRSKAENFGICRIVPPISWTPPCTLEEKSIWETLKINTCVQKISELQNVHLDNEYEKGKHKRRKVETCRTFENGPDFTLETFKKYADDFQKKYFSKKNGEKIVSSREFEPSVKDIEGEYWRIIEKPTEEIEVLCAIDMDTQVIKSGFPLKSNSITHDYATSDWNLNNLPTLSGSLLSFENNKTSEILSPRLSIGMCFSSFSWSIEEHHLYSLSYSHIGASRIYYSIPAKYRTKFEEVMKKHYPQLLKHPELFHKLVNEISPSTLISSGIPVYRCVQNPREFILIFPGVYNLTFNCGFNCSEVANFAPFDWLLHGENIIQVYTEQQRKTKISYDKILLGAAIKAVRAQWELLVIKKVSLDNQLWSSACGEDSVLSTALKSRVKSEKLRREFLCKSSKSSKMEEDFDVCIKRECFICFYDVHLSYTSCVCSPNKYTCLFHAKQLCSCAWSTRSFFYRYEISELEMLVEALEGNLPAIHRWVNRKIGNEDEKSSKLVCDNAKQGENLVSDRVDVIVLSDDED